MMNSTMPTSVAGRLSGGGVGSVLSAVVVGVVLASATVRLTAWLRRYSRFRRLEMAIPGPVSLPILGSLHLFTRINEDNVFRSFLDLWSGRSTELFRIAIFDYLMVIVSDPDHISKVLRDRRFTDKPWIMYWPLSCIIGDGLVTSSGSSWKNHRTLLQPTFHVEILEKFVDVFAEEATALAHRLRSFVGQDFEFQGEMHRTTAHSVIRTTLSSTFTEDDEDLAALLEGITHCLKMVNRRSLNPILWPDFIFDRTTMGLKQATYRRFALKYVEGLIDRKTEEIKAKTGGDHVDQLEGKLGFKVRKTFLDMLLEGNLSGQSDLSPQDMTDECITIFFAAIETSVTVLTFVFKMLSIRPDIQDRVYAELCDVFEGSDRPITSQDLPRLEYTERVIKETLRIFPIAPFIGRQVHEEVEVVGKQVPAGAVIVINIFSAHRDPRHHPDPLQFDPDRFLPERTAKWHPYSYMPFSLGPRNCIGNRYAMMQMKTILSTVLRSYLIRPADDNIKHPSDFPLTFDIVLRIVGGTKVRFEHREVALEAGLTGLK